MSGPILVLTRHYAPEPTGSAPPMQRLAEWLAAHVGPVQVVTSRPTYPERRVTPGYEHGARDRAIEGRVAVRRFPALPPRGAGLLARAVPEARFMLQLLAARLTGRMQPSRQVISLCPSILTVVAAAAFRRRGGRHVAVVHDLPSGLGAALGSRGLRPVLALLRMVERWALGRADHVVVLSEAMAAAVRGLGVRTPVAVLAPPIDCAGITPRPKPAGLPRAVVMYSGSFGRKQGLEQLLDMAAILRAGAPGVLVILRGDGAARPAIEAQVAARDLANVRLLPLVPPDAVSASLAEGDVHLVPQIAEGGDFAVPSKAFAIMAAGRPFVATADEGSSLGMLARETEAFEVVPPGDPAALAARVLALLDDAPRRRRLGENGRAYVEARVDTAVVGRRIAALLEVDEAPAPALEAAAAR